MRNWSILHSPIPNSHPTRLSPLLKLLIWTRSIRFFLRFSDVAVLGTDTDRKSTASLRENSQNSKGDFTLYFYPLSSSSRRSCCLNLDRSPVFIWRTQTVARPVDVL